MKGQKRVSGRPTKAQLIMAYATMAKGDLNTGIRDSKGRAIYQGPRGGRFVRCKGRKVYK